jgi:multiple antibiotic resistance protein
MAEHWTEYTRFLTTLLAILDPFFAIPVFLALTEGRGPGDRARTATVTVLTVLAVLLATALAGEPLLRLLGTSLPSFRVGGGLVLLMMSISMLSTLEDPWRHTREEREAAVGKATVAVVPLAIPLLAGPGAISAVIIEMHRSPVLGHRAAVLATIVLACLLLWLMLLLAVPIGRAMGPLAMKVANRLLGLLLAAISVEIMAGGLKELFPGLQG